MIFIPKSLAHVVLSSWHILCVSVCTGVCAETAKVKPLMDQETQNIANISHKGAESNPCAQSIFNREN